MNINTNNKCLCKYDRSLCKYDTLVIAIKVKLLANIHHVHLQQKVDTYISKLCSMLYLYL